MEETVAEFASRLLSDDLNIATNAAAALKEAFSSRPAESSYLPRLIQELAIYQQGCVVRKLMKQVLVERSPIQYVPLESPGVFFASSGSEKVGLKHMSFLELTFLASSKSVAQFSLRGEGVAKRLFQLCMDNLAECRKPCSPESFSVRLIPTLQSLLNYTRASKSFRQLMRGCEDLLPALEFLLLEEVVNAMPDKSLISSIRGNLAFIILDLSLSEDSQAWMIENGFLRLLASILRTANLDEEDRMATRSCCVVLTRLCDSRTCLSKLKEADDVLSILKPYSTLLNSTIPRVWDAFLRKLTSGEESFEQASGAIKKSMWKYYGKANMFNIPTVCSWEGCLETADVDFEKGTRFSKCGRCAVAHYCSKDHQKLHWPTHKKHCLKKGETPSEGQKN